MKTSIILFLTVILILTAACRTPNRSNLNPAPVLEEIAISDPILKEHLLTLYDADNSQTLTKNEAANVQAINFTGTGSQTAIAEISSLIGKNFPHLEEITLINHAITEADLSALPRLKKINITNKGLQKLTLGSKERLTSLTYGTDITAAQTIIAAKLTDLDIKNNKIAAIDITGSPALVNINLKNTDIVELNISQNPNINEIDLTGMTKLTKIIMLDDNQKSKVSLVGRPSGVTVETIN